MNERMPAVANDKDFEILQRMSMALFKSGYFPDVKSEAQAIVKVMAGAELGIPPFASMTGINIVQGKPVLGSNLIATLVDNSPRYDFRVISPYDKDREICSIEWYRNGEKVGQSSFTITEAQSIQQWSKKKSAWESLSDKHNWKNYPSDMLFARAISRGVKRFAPGIFGGSPVYTPDEMGVDMDPDGYVDVVEGRLSDNTDIFIEEEIPAAEHTPDPIEPELSENGQEGKGKPEPKFNGNIADARAWLEERGPTILGVIADAAVMTGEYDDREHVKNTLLLDEPEMVEMQEMGLGTDFRRKVDNTLMVYDRLMARKEEKADGHR